MTLCRILFVDDEPELLNGLAKALRKHRARWDMVFAVGAEAALDELARSRFDVVVSDMRMPQIDGAQLLGRARDIDPTAFRIILSGYSDRDSLSRSLSVAHQFFDKPCDLAELRAAIDRAHQLHQLFASDAVLRVIGRIATVPSVPPAYHELAALSALPESSFDAFVAVIERDPELCRGVLQLAGTPTAADALAQLGIEAACGLVLAAHAFAAFAASSDQRERSLRVAVAVSSLVQGADAFSAGILHNLGAVMIASELPDEREVLGTTPAELGAYVLGTWGLPLSIVSAVAQHDDAAPAASLAALLRPT